MCRKGVTRGLTRYGAGALCGRPENLGSEVIWRVGALSQCREPAKRVYHGAVFEINMVE